MADKKTITFEIVTLERVVLKQEILQITVPTQSGEITVLPHHIPLVSILKPGVIEIKNIGGGIDIISISGGFIEVFKDRIIILADTAERAAELDENRIIKARQLAVEAKEKFLSDDHFDLSTVAAKLDVELAREKALHRWRKLKNIK